MAAVVTSGKPLVTYVSIQVVTPSDTVDLPTPTRGILLSVAGTLKVDTNYDTGITLTVLNVGQVHPLQIKRVYATGTTATGIFAIY